MAYLHRARQELRNVMEAVDDPALQKSQQDLSTGLAEMRQIRSELLAMRSVSLGSLRQGTAAVPPWCWRGNHCGVCL